ncbi:MAG: coproporphyrinogen III oxidase family protein [Planctomycetes bacterium]|nr:coproporphyrinogen III oxidase family protein [Planctomycetota bacterium]
MRSLREHGAFANSGVEVTIEANPESCSLEKLQCYRELGANRISIGAQSFKPEYLEMFDRVHSPEQIAIAVETARTAGFNRINLDLIFAKPRETLESWLGDLETALDFHTDHLSCYELAFEEGTKIRKDMLARRVEPLSEETCLDFYHRTISRVQLSGLESYEISAFAKPGAECRHNLVYWTSGDWVGVGAGAGTSLDRTKYLNIKNPDLYTSAMDASLPAVDRNTFEESPPRQRAVEILMMGLRLRAGIPLERVSARAGLDAKAAFADAFEKLIRSELLTLDALGWISLTDRGRDIANHVIAEFMADPRSATAGAP